jgi:hypothetical protein
VRPGRSSRASRLLPELGAAVVLLLLVVAFNPGLALQGRVLGGYDAFVYFYPLRSYVAETLGHGTLPLWNPYLFAGTPYVANPQTSIFYPGTWLFALIDTPRAYALNFLAHLWITGLGFYALARLSLGLGRVAGVLGGAALAFSGLMNGQAGHINQFSAVAWLPALALAADAATCSARVLPMAGLVLGLTLQIVAGHPQQVYMTAVMLGIVVAWRALVITTAGQNTAGPATASHPAAGRTTASQDAAPPGPASAGAGWRSGVVALVRGGLCLGLAGGLAGGISAIQLLPTLELSGLSIRGGGLSYQLAAFDALPWPLLLPALFPGYWAHLPSTEFFGHLGTVMFAIAWLGLLAGSGRPALLGAMFVAGGLLLAVGDATSLYRALYDWAPGFASFRVPARWLLVSTFGLAILAAVGTNWLVGWLSRLERGLPVLATLAALLREVGVPRALFAGVAVPLGLASLVVLGQPQSKWLLLVWGLGVIATLLLAALVCRVPRLRRPALTVLLLGALADLWLAGMGLEHRNPVPNIAYHQPREAISELQARAARDGGYRMLSIATTEYVPKETGEYEERYAGLPAQALLNLFFTVKWNETLLPNVPLVHRLATADGYDGGVLPLRAFYDFGKAMLGDEQARPDGVLASRLDVLPDARWLDLLGVRWAIASRVKDDTRGAIYYDRAVTRALQPGESFTLTALPGGSFTTLGMISSVASIPDGSPSSGGREPPTGSRAGVLRLDAGDGAWQEIPLTIGQATAPASWKHEQAPSLERVETWSSRGPDDPADWIAEITLPHRPIARLQIENTTTRFVLQVRALNLVDDERQMAFPITPDSRIERVDFFDLKLYDRQDALPRAYVVPAAQVVADDEAATARLRDPSFEPRSEAVLAQSSTAAELAADPAGGNPVGTAAFRVDQPEHIVIGATATADSYLVLSDSWYPGWRATVDGAEVPIERANLLFRAVRLTRGEHVVEFRYEPRSVRIGGLISGWSIVASMVLLIGALAWGRWRRRRRAA